jgi:hypothetical protein
MYSYSDARQGVCCCRMRSAGRNGRHMGVALERGARAAMAQSVLSQRSGRAVGKIVG